MMMIPEEPPKTYGEAFNRVFNREIRRLKNERPDGPEWRAVAEARDLAHRLTPIEFPDLAKDVLE